MILKYILFKTCSVFYCTYNIKTESIQKIKYHNYEYYLKQKPEYRKFTLYIFIKIAKEVIAFSSDFMRICFKNKYMLYGD